jgi:adenosylcobinamide-phosphate synthase
MTPTSPGIILGALALDLLLGDPRWLPHPVVGIGRFITGAEGVLRQTGMDMKAAGVLLLVTTVGTTAGAAWLLLTGALLLHHLAGEGVALFLSYSCLAARSLQGESKLVADALEAGDLPRARQLLSRIVGRDTEHLAEPEIWRALVETVAENSSDGVIAPLICLMVGGPVLGIAYKAVNTLDSMVGYKNDRYLRFGWASARFDDLANWLPARLTGLLMILVSPLVGLSPAGGWRIMCRDGRKHASPNSGIPEAAAAGALGVRLGGTNSYFGTPMTKPTMGEPLSPLSRDSWAGAVRLMYGAEGALMALYLAAVGSLT